MIVIVKMWRWFSMQVFVEKEYVKEKYCTI
jgi:hypothetical protein